MSRYLVENISSRTITITDVTTYGIELTPGKRIDLTKLASMNKIQTSRDLAHAVRLGYLRVLDRLGVDLPTTDLSVGYLDGTVVDISLDSLDSDGGSSVPSSSVFARDSDGRITSVTYASGRVITINRVGGFISTVVDSVVGTYTINRDLSGVITGITFSS